MFCNTIYFFPNFNRPASWNSHRIRNCLLLFLLLSGRLGSQPMDGNKCLMIILLFKIIVEVARGVGGQSRWMNKLQFCGYGGGGDNWGGGKEANLIFGAPFNTPKKWF